MGRLIDPGVGELWDRYTILSLKILAADTDTVSVDHWLAEQQAIQARLPSGRGEAWREPLASLRRINQDLWDAEDQMAAAVTQDEILSHDAATLVTLGDLGMEIWRLNHLRNHLIREINQLAGTDVGPEKL